jgi:uncharacterized RDD family membrane protein YckC
VSLAIRRPGRYATTAAASSVAAIEADAPAVAPASYVGLVTRAIAFAIDAAVINAVAIITSAVVLLTFSIVTIPDELRTVAAALGGALYVLWLVGYFVTFWSTTGQTPGSRALRIRVRPAHGDVLRPRRSLVRFVGLTLAALPLFAGFLLILVDDRRRGLHDRLARTVVVEDVITDQRPRGGSPRGRAGAPGAAAP